MCSPAASHGEISYGADGLVFDADGHSFDFASTTRGRDRGSQSTSPNVGRGAEVVRVVSDPGSALLIAPAIARP